MHDYFSVLDSLQYVWLAQSVELPERSKEKKAVATRTYVVGSFVLNVTSIVIQVQDSIFFINLDYGIWGHEPRGIHDFVKAIEK